MSDGGPAFPEAIAVGPAGDIYAASNTFGVAAGMSLRDWFATRALPFCLAEFGGNAEDQRQYAEAAYQIADAMLLARAKSPLHYGSQPPDEGEWEEVTAGIWRKA